MQEPYVMQSQLRVEEFIAAYNRKDAPGALACFTHDAIYQDVTYGTHSGQDELKTMLERMFLEADACGKVCTSVADAVRVGHRCADFPACISFEKHPFEHRFQLVLTAVRAVRHVLIDRVVGETGQRTRSVLAIVCSNEFFN